ncbi:MAG: hypothetical protein MR609_01355 [Bacteroidales bacterium]|nr:hypothetical protein [Bacteroidales bacterium]
MGFVRCPYGVRTVLRPVRGRVAQRATISVPHTKTAERSMCGVPEGQINPYSHSVAEPLFGTYGAVWK